MFQKRSKFSETKAARHLWVCLGLLLLSAAGCGSRVEQHNERPLLVTKWGGTDGGPIQGTLRVRAFDDTTRFPFPGVVVSLGSSGAVTAVTDGQGLATFLGVAGPQDIHLFACAGCTDPQAVPLFYQIASFYQVNAAEVAVPLVPRDPAISNGTIEGKVFDVNRDQKTYLSSIDEQGRLVVAGPLRSITHQQVIPGRPVCPDSTARPPGMSFVFAKNLDDWAAADPAAGRQNFGTAALLGTVVGITGCPQGGVQVSAEYFQGFDAGRPYYFRDDETDDQIDPSLTATSGNGRFLFLRLVPDNDLAVSAASLGVGVGRTTIHIRRGTSIFSLPVLPLTQRSVDLSGRIVSYRINFREAERSGPLSNTNEGVPGALLLFSGDPQDSGVIADRGVTIAGNYRAEGRLAPNSENVAVINFGQLYRPTYQKVRMGARSKLNYPLAIVPILPLARMVQEAEIVDESVPVVNGRPNYRLGLLPRHGEILGRVVALDGGKVDANGDPVVIPVRDASISVFDADGNEAGRWFYLDGDARVIDPNDQELQKTSESGGFVVFDLPANPPAPYTLIVKKDDIVIDRQTLTVYPDSVVLVESFEQAEGTQVEATVRDTAKRPLEGALLSVVGEKLDCGPVPCQSGEDGNMPGVLPRLGEYMVRMEREGGGGDFQVPFRGSKRQIGFSAFQLAPDDALESTTFAGALGPLSPGRRLPFDVIFEPPPVFTETTGSVALPSGFSQGDLKAVMLGAVSPGGRVFIGTDPLLLAGRAREGYRVLSQDAQGSLSYFIVGIAQNAAGESSRVWAQGLNAIPAARDLAFGSPPRLISPAEGQGRMGVTPRLSWAAPEEGPADLYRVSLSNSGGNLLWEAWVPGAVTEISIPAFPDSAPAQLKPLSQGQTVRWDVQAIRAGGVSIDRFNLMELSERRTGDASSRSHFTP